MGKKYILDKAAIQLKLERMALEIAERNLDAAHIVLAGIAPAGPLMNEVITKALKKYFAGAVSSVTITLDNKKVPKKVSVSESPDLTEAVLIITDDVSNSGKTQTFALQPFLSPLPKAMQTLVLVNRSHKAFPVQPDYVGISLATTIEEYIDVEIEDNVLTAVWMK